MAPTELNFLLSTPYFRTCDLKSMGDFFHHLQMRRISANHTVFEEGQVESGWYLIRRGNIQIKRKSALGINYVLAELSEGEAFGEMSLLDAGPRLASAIATEDTILYFMDGATFTTMLENKDPVAFTMLRAMAITQSRRLREMTLTLQDLTDLDDLGDYAPMGNTLSANPLDFATLMSASILR